MQTVETFQKGGVPAFVETLDAVEVGRKAGMPIAPVMIYGDDVSHVVTEEGIAYLYKTQGIGQRRKALAAVAGVSPIGLRAKWGNSGASHDRHRGVSGRPRSATPESRPLSAGRSQHGRSGRGPAASTRRLPGSGAGKCRQTRPWPFHNSRVPGISLVFREMWETANFDHVAPTALDLKVGSHPLRARR